MREIAAILEGFERRDPAALARAISLVENQRAGFEQLLARVLAAPGRIETPARRTGLTGPPGAGKSTLTERLIRHFRERGESVGVIAVDPTSPFTGGALLGDRIRMESPEVDSGVFIRSMATRGAHGGLAVTTEEVARLLEAFGFGQVLIETVGVGQTELDVAGAADTTVLVLVPESGDAVQTLKAGVMEIADIYVLNKSDRPGADKLGHEIEIMVSMRRGSRSGAWEPPVVKTVATTGDGIGELTAALERHRTYLEHSGVLQARRRQRVEMLTRAVITRTLKRWVWEAARVDEVLAERLDDVLDGRQSPYELAQAVIEQVKSGALE
ncbi:MAG TPA: methylmalonyl Co-A mutase-associated GTPase MeaB [Gemmatimonadales bacterium]|nr:methylmalonyl Co-A mutase-associated GTPase MeaB [Gemmatimonadales bacterium]